MGPGFLDELFKPITKRNVILTILGIIFVSIGLWELLKFLFSHVSFTWR